ncbi:MAG: hypothetical protein OMM_10262 [Candidatus Magnetoglobus multicellularis str. Araruama]|jgi:hypothetical protein|uniref:Uncharacterized protein n=1 Tax=Candidatus Magnetoglobus multicellularis str. Araruama TaxID=890399 RepID=A0A1V1P1S3_9BACT|nr:MAG: hypothetical protein OMM_10262 [Candidatus Magnetoglobus multicellularis str. Araruama]
MKGLVMHWNQIRSFYPDKFILLRNYQTETIDNKHFRVIGGDVISNHNDYNELQKEYKQYRSKGEDVIFCLPQTEDFVVETKPMMGILNENYRT